MYWQNLTSRALNSVDRRVPVVLPTAAIEQHGPHLPLATDRIINEHFCREIEARMSERVLLLPTVAVTCSRHHMDFPGTLTLSHNTYMRQLLDTLKSVAAHGFRNLVIFNSHGGNHAANQVVLERFGASHPECRVVMMSWWNLANEPLRKITETERGGVGHACEFETSLVLLAAPELVDTAAIARGQNQSTFDWAEGDMLHGPRVSLYRSLKQMSPNGAYGDPTRATAEKGRAITHVVVTALQQVLDDLYKR